MDAESRINLDKKVDMIGHHFQFDHFDLSRVCCLADERFQPSIYRLDEYGTPVLRAPNDVVLARIHHVVVAFVVHQVDYAARRNLIQRE